MICACGSITVANHRNTVAVAHQDLAIDDPAGQVKSVVTGVELMATPEPGITPLLDRLLSNAPLNSSPWAVFPVVTPVLLMVAAPLTRVMPVNWPMIDPALSKVPPPLASTSLANGFRYGRWRYW